MASDNGLAPNRPQRHSMWGNICNLKLISHSLFDWRCWYRLSVGRTISSLSKMYIYIYILSIACLYWVLEITSFQIVLCEYTIVVMLHNQIIYHNNSCKIAQSLSYLRSQKEMYIVFNMVSTIFLLDANIENKIQSNITGPCCLTRFVTLRFQTYKISHGNIYLYVKYIDQFLIFRIYAFEYNHVRNMVSAIENCFAKWPSDI